MNITSTRAVLIAFSRDIISRITLNALDNTVTPGIAADMVTLTTANSGNNTIAVPSGTGIVVTGLTIVPPDDNTDVIILKGVAGDTGIPLHVTDPTSIGLNSTFASLVLHVAAQIDNVRLIWT